MMKNDKPKRDEGGTPFRREYAAPMDEVVRALMRLDRSYWLMIIGDMHLEEGSAGYTFEFRQKIANRMTSEIKAHIWQDDAGRTIIEGVFRKLTLSLSFLFLTTLVVAILSAAFLLISLVSTTPDSTDTLFKTIALLSMISLAATFFYALRYDTAYYVTNGACLGLQPIPSRRNWFLEPLNPSYEAHKGPKRLCRGAMHRAPTPIPTQVLDLHHWLCTKGIAAASSEAAIPGQGCSYG